MTDRGRLGVIVLAIGGVLALAGCTPAPSPTVTTTVTVSPSASPSASPSPRTGRCADADLTITIAPDPGGAGAGSVYYDVVFTNSGSSSCTLGGQPGVSVVNASGTQLGNPASSGGEAPPYLSIAPGAAVYALLRVAEPGNLDGCTVVNGTGWAVYAPGSYKRVVVRSDAQVPACSPGPVFMSVAAVAPGTHA